MGIAARDHDEEVVEQILNDLSGGFVDQHEPGELSEASGDHAGEEARRSRRDRAARTRRSQGFGRRRLVRPGRHGRRGRRRRRRGRQRIPDEAKASDVEALVIGDHWVSFLLRERFGGSADRRRGSGVRDCRGVRGTGRRRRRGGRRSTSGGRMPRRGSFVASDIWATVRGRRSTSSSGTTCDERVPIGTCSKTHGSRERSVRMWT